MRLTGGASLTKLRRSVKQSGRLHRAARKTPKSALPGCRWATEEAGIFLLAVPGDNIGAEVDEAWSAERPAGAGNAHWLWANLLAKSRDRFALIAPDGSTAALWCAFETKLKKLPGGAAYRVDYLEVAPEFCERGLGTLAVALACSRALELTAERMLCPAVPQSVVFHTKLGATPGEVPGWKPPGDLIPFSYEPPLVRRLKGMADALRVEED